MVTKIFCDIVELGQIEKFNKKIFLIYKELIV